MMSQTTMRAIVTFALILFLVLHGNCYIYTIQNATSTEFPGKCYHNISKLDLNPGETQKIPGSCEKITCNTDFSIDGIGCGFVTPARPPCRDVPEDVTKPFPECCASVAC